jgi:hypothetical protein
LEPFLSKCVQICNWEPFLRCISEHLYRYLMPIYWE